jgi:hypothetical protein
MDTVPAWQSLRQLLWAGLVDYYVRLKPLPQVWPVPISGSSHRKVKRIDSGPSRDFESWLKTVRIVRMEWVLSCVCKGGSWTKMSFSIFAKFGNSENCKTQKNLQNISIFLKKFSQQNLVKIRKNFGKQQLDVHLLLSCTYFAETFKKIIFLLKQKYPCNSFAMIC